MVNKGKKKKSHEARCKMIKWALVVSDTAHARLQSAFLQLNCMCSRLGNFLVCYEASLVFSFFAPAIQLLNCYHIANDLSPHLLLNVYKQRFSFSVLRGNTASPNTHCPHPMNETLLANSLAFIKFGVESSYNHLEVRSSPSRALLVSRRML